MRLITFPTILIEFLEDIQKKLKFSKISFMLSVFEGIGEVM
jgi:hypothetical protein